MKLVPISFKNARKYSHLSGTERLQVMIQSPVNTLSPTMFGIGSHVHYTLEANAPDSRDHFFIQEVVLSKLWKVFYN